MSTNRFDLLILGNGLAGCAAAVFAAREGLATAVVGATDGELLFASGLLDVLGVFPPEEGRQWPNPELGWQRLVRHHPNHPYALSDFQKAVEAVESLTDFLSKAGLPYAGFSRRNCRVVTPAGTVKTTFRVPQTMWPGVQSMERKQPALLVDFRGFKEYSSHHMAGRLCSRWPTVRAARIEFPGTLQRSELYGQHLAHSLEVPAVREALAAAVLPLCEGVEAVGFPAVLGVHDSPAVCRDLSERLGRPVFETPTLPPSVPGLRLKETFSSALESCGVQMIPHHRAQNVSAIEDGYEVVVQGQEGAQTLRARGVVLATGRFVGGGLRAERKRIRETLLDLPVIAPSSRAHWHRSEMLDLRGHPINRSGVAVDAACRPLSEAGRPWGTHVYAVGSLLAYQDWMRTKSGAGMAITTAAHAVKHFAHTG
ncbi:glycerol-3-phosphate dehydrogenase subunit GlpB [Desulfohalobium retbaense]|uniref:Glycerol-3-phosphate dehydrogenase, anaerobic, B subunit n=1 Tax=Desulfohalobium retbaense (strain ATCC 49708 / DSM 5692 / JCM 16813 / HR100) TaxID=485915 RepID=C8X4B1_DESRD|nr:glycerol-3-phosphate dehydrogenase subunit GlpB [Desulfohalobium retbaense]ACV69385.1 glycerol-3-phosphate dehydrogenase, anaerobic, B subunit [Desulfohalobium retbaense DSM 5692]